MNESGFHATIQNPNGDTGIGQLTGKAIADVDRVLAGQRQFVWSSEKSSCRWLKRATEKLPEVWREVGGRSRCSLMASEANPIKSLVYVAIFHRLNQRYVDLAFEREGILDLLKEMKFPGGRVDRLKKMLVMLGYNTGGETAVRNLREFLLSRQDFTRRKSEELWRPEFLTMSRRERHVALGYLTARDFDFTSGLQRLNERRAHYEQVFRAEEPALSGSEIRRLVDTQMRDISVSELSFPEWLRIWQTHGGPGYVSRLATTSRKLDRQFGEGACAALETYRLN
jgi:hypothetical protein